MTMIQKYNGRPKCAFCNCPSDGRWRTNLCEFEACSDCAEYILPRHKPEHIELAIAEMRMRFWYLLHRLPVYDDPRFTKREVRH